jgi:alpha/beta superfamily hydrolase
MAYPAGNSFITVPHGQLEAILKEPGKAATGAALVLHPLPTGGGTMHNKVVFRAASALNDAGVITLRINFRGVGQSTGAFEGGPGELDDARAGLAHLESSYPNKPLTICGFSFGARIGMELGASDARVKYLISIGTPVDKYDFSFLKGSAKPILFVHGEHDEYGRLDRLRELVREIQKTAPVTLVAISGAGHFFDNQLGELKQAIYDWMTARIKEAKPAAT